MRTRLTARLARWLPLLMVGVGIVKGAFVLWLAPHVGAPFWMAATAASLWVIGPAVVARIWQRRLDRRASMPRPQAGLVSSTVGR